MNTIHDEAAEKVELAKAYAEDGAFASAARIYREIANMYQQRANYIAGQIEAERAGTIGPLSIATNGEN